jgi:hypothetical protein
VHRLYLGQTIRANELALNVQSDTNVEASVHGDAVESIDGSLSLFGVRQFAVGLLVERKHMLFRMTMKWRRTGTDMQKVKWEATV